MSARIQAPGRLRSLVDLSSPPGEFDLLALIEPRGGGASDEELGRTRPWTPYRDDSSDSEEDDQVPKGGIGVHSGRTGLAPHSGSIALPVAGQTSDLSAFAAAFRPGTVSQARAELRAVRAPEPSSSAQSEFLIHLPDGSTLVQRSGASVPVGVGRTGRNTTRAGSSLHIARTEGEVLEQVQRLVLGGRRGRLLDQAARPGRTQAQTRRGTQVQAQSQADWRERLARQLRHHLRRDTSTRHPASSPSPTDTSSSPSPPSVFEDLDPFRSFYSTPGSSLPSSAPNSIALPSLPAPVSCRQAIIPSLSSDSNTVRGWFVFDTPDLPFPGAEPGRKWKAPEDLAEQCTDLVLFRRRPRHASAAAPIPVNEADYETRLNQVVDSFEARGPSAANTALIELATDVESNTTSESAVSTSDVGDEPQLRQIAHESESEYDSDQSQSDADVTDEQLRLYEEPDLLGPIYGEDSSYDLAFGPIEISPNELIMAEDHLDAVDSGGAMTDAHLVAASDPPLAASAPAPRPGGPAPDPIPSFTSIFRTSKIRTHIPSHLLTTSDSLQNTLLNSWQRVEPTDEEKREIPALCFQLTRLINMRLGGYFGVKDRGEERFEVELFGSMSWGGQTGQHGDVDLVIKDRLLPQGYLPSLWTTPPTDGALDLLADVVAHNDLPALYDMRRLVTVLRNAGFRDATGIYGASTPIVKFTAPIGPRLFKIDININDLGGWYNSRLILAYCNISPQVLRPLIHALKLWASANEINDPSGSHGPATMSSYCLTLMAIAYLQHRGALPNLQANVSYKSPDKPTENGSDIVWVGWGKPNGIKAHIGFETDPPPGWTPRDPGLTASNALRGFFTYFALKSPSGGPNIAADRFNYSTQVISVLNGGIIGRARSLGEETRHAQAGLAGEKMTKEEMMGKGNGGIQPRNWGNRRLIVQDPFIWQKAMHKKGLDRWWDAVDRSHQILTKRGSQASLADILVNFQPLTPRVPTPGRGRGSPIFARGRGSPNSRGRGGGMLWSSSPAPGGARLWTASTAPPSATRNYGIGP